MSDESPPKQRRRARAEKLHIFAREYLKHFNITKAAIAAGYSSRSAHVTGSRLLNDAKVKEIIKQASERRAKRYELTVDNITDELAKIAKSDPRMLMEWGPNGVTLRDSDDLNDDDAACVSEVSQTISKDGGSIKLKMHSKVEALKTLLAHIAPSNAAVSSVPIGNQRVLLIDNSGEKPIVKDLTATETTTADSDMVEGIPEDDSEDVD